MTLKNAITYWMKICHLVNLMVQVECLKWLGNVNKHWK